MTYSDFTCKILLLYLYVFLSLAVLECVSQLLKINFNNMIKYLYNKYFGKVVKMFNFKKNITCPNCNSDNIQITSNYRFYMFNRVIFIIMIVLLLVNVQYLEKHIFITLLLLLLLSSYIIIFSHSAIYMECKICHTSFNYFSSYNNKDEDIDPNKTFNIIFRTSVFQMLFCGLINLLICTIIIFYSPFTEHTNSIIFLFSSMIVSSTYIIVTTPDMEEWISRGTLLNKKEINFNKVYDTSAKLFGLLTTFYTLMYTKLSGQSHFDLNFFLYLNCILFSLSFSNFILEYITYKSEK